MVSWRLLFETLYGLHYAVFYQQNVFKHELRNILARVMLL